MSSLQDVNEKRFEFKILSENELPLLYDWVNQPEVVRWWVDVGLDWSDFKQKYLGKLSNGIEFPYIVYFDEQPIGYIEYYLANKVGGGWWLDQPAGVYGIDVFIGGAEILGKGYGSIFLRKFVDFLIAKPEVKKIIIDPAVDNNRAIRCYEKVGFSPVGQVKTPLGISFLMEIQVEACSEICQQESLPLPSTQLSLFGS